MIKAVFLDFYGTLVKWVPAAEEIQQQAAAAEGLRVEPVAIARAYPAANAYMDVANAREPLASRSDDARARFFTEYERRLLAAAGYDVPAGLARRIWERVRSTPKELGLYDDARPALEQLAAARLILGVISNIGPELGTMIAHLGLADYVGLWVSSQEVGVSKPHAAVFEAGLRKAGVQPREAIHVGDSYEADVVGARNAAMHPLLLWREPGGPPPDGCPTVTTLTDVLSYLRRSGLVEVGS